MEAANTYIFLPTLAVSYELIVVKLKSDPK